MTLGVLCGLRSEAKIADKLPNAFVACGAARQASSESLARQLVDKKVKRLISFGLAAGLSSDMEAGDLLLGATVVSEKGAWEADESWNARLLEYLPCYQCAPIWGSDVILATVKDKARCAARSGCLAADMESHIVARAAVKAGIPFNVLRAVSDTFDVDLPGAVFVPLLDDGGVNLRGVFASIFKEPRQIPDLARLGFATHKALSGLRQAVAVISALGK